MYNPACADDMLIYAGSVYSDITYQWKRGSNPNKQVMTHCAHPPDDALCAPPVDPGGMSGEAEGCWDKKGKVCY